MKPVVIAGYKRSPFHFAHKGQLVKKRPDDLAADVMRGLIESSGIDPAGVEDLIMGCAFGYFNPVATADRVGLTDPRHTDDAGRNPHLAGLRHGLSRSQIYKKHANPTINSNILILRFLGHAERVHSRRCPVQCHAGNL